MNDLSMDAAPADILILGDDELDQVNGGFIPLLIGAAAAGFFTGVYFGSLTVQMINAIRNR